jgi:aldehyde:ferredoxin oxidoreductase
VIYGNHGKLLRINLEEKKFGVEEISEKTLNETIGGKGLGTHLLLTEVDPQADPLSPANKIIFTAGPACDTRIPASSRYGVFAKSPLTGIYTESYSGGHLAPVMKRTGFDAIILEGMSGTPVYLHVNHGGVTFHEAGHLWGLESYETEDRIKKEVGIRNAQALVIGPAGEKLVKFACIKNNYWRSAGRTGLGAVMGSKKVKGLIFSGDARAPLADPALLKEYICSLKEKGKDNAAVKAYYNFGTPMMVAILNEVNSFPSRYWHRGNSENWRNLSAEYLRDNLKVRSRACRSCYMACGKLSRVLKGRHKGLTIEGPEYETIYAFGGLCCIDQLEEVIYLNDLCDRLGLDTISTGNLAAFAIEASLEGKVKGAPAYGDVDGIAELVKKISARQGLGDVLADGIKSASQKLGLEDMAIHVKGMEPAGYDPRVFKGMGLAYAISDRGACHLRTTFYKPELSGIISPQQIEGKAELLIDYEDRAVLFDCLIFCRFYRDLVTWDDLSTVIAATTGQQLSKEQLQRTANNVVSWARMFNLKAGISKKDDTLPPRFFEEPLDKEGNQVITREELEYLVNDYYQLRGWDEEGVP